MTRQAFLATAMLLGFLVPAFAAARTEPTIGRAPIEADALAPLARELAGRMEKAASGRRAGGLGLALVIDGEVRWLDARGYADRETRARFTPDTRLPLGELSRLHTAAIAFRLASRGELDLDAPVTRYVPDLPIGGLPTDAAPPTVRQLLAHQSGLPWTVLRGSWRQPEEPAVALDWARALHVTHPPGTLTVVSNLGYALLGEVLEAASGLSYAELLARELADPLGLPATSTAHDAAVARAHRDGKVEPAWIARDAAAQGVVSSLADLARLAAALMPGVARATPLLDEAALRAMTTPANADLPLDLGNAQGIPWSLATSIRPGVGRVAVLVGVAPGFRAEVRIALDHALAVVAVANFDGRRESLFDLSADALDALLAIRAGAPKRDRDRPLPERVPWPPGAAPDEPAPRYVTPGGELLVEPRAPGFRATAAGIRFRADPRGDGWYRARYDLLGVIPIGFERLDRVAIAPVRIGTVRALIAFTAERWFLLGTAYEPTPSAADDLVGEYRIADADGLLRDAKIDRVRLERRDGQLVATYRIPFVIDIRPVIPLRRIDATTVITEGLGPNQGERLVFDLDGPEPAFTYSGYRFERVPAR
jgi:CubicO group peptidase (beta-lactamase class C family)